MNATADCDLGEENLLPGNSVEMDVSNAKISQESSLDNNNLRRCQKIQYHIEEYTLSFQKRTEVEAIIKNAELIPCLYGPQDHEHHKMEMKRWNFGDNQNRTNKPFTSNEIRPDTTFAQALKPKTVQQRAQLDGNPAEATTIPRGENNNINNQCQQSETSNGFTLFDAIKELKTFFQLFPGLMGACEQMRKTSDKTDKLNIFFQAICTQI
ncbi:hypothetical protein NPIL_95671 [Nephila pilipes]|uniref:Uncharacterized protein n=1 Tax=Nephila pilipes TaxID=299642 RepID=A0A8X6Q1V3_NEPPI|nr:hypothetical protein NPIL_95671 [Nephila pilipes]